MIKVDPWRDVVVDYDRCPYCAHRLEEKSLSKTNAFDMEAAGYVDHIWWYCTACILTFEAA